MKENLIFLWNYQLTFVVNKEKYKAKTNFVKFSIEVEKLKNCL